MFTADSRTENFLTSLGVKHEYRNGLKIPADLVRGWNQENIGRPVAVREDAVIEYAALMEQGSAAPAPILYQTDSGFRVLDGVQRISAAELNGMTLVSAYVVLTDSEDMLAAIRVLANARMQGRAEPAEWTRRRAVEVLVGARGLSCAEVARLGGWKTSDIHRISDAIELQKRIASIGGPELPDAMLSELKPHIQSVPIEQAAEPVAGFLNTLKKAKLSTADARPFIETFFSPLLKSQNPHKTYGSRLAEIHKDPEVIARVSGRQGAAIPRDVVLLRELKSADTVLDAILTHGEKVANVDEFFRVVSRITGKLKTLAPNKPPMTSRVPADMWSDKQ